MTEYEFWLKSSRKCAHNTAVKYISNLRKVVNICLKNGWLVRDPFLGYKMTKREVERAVLTQNEIDLTSQKVFPKGDNQLPGIRRALYFRYTYQ
ncbi:phage integrase SAM-like domain-containing protein [Fulvivirgaceae bacterium QH1ED-6-2]|nr:phage integrase SAM-like domain-containing protein [Parachryseolinea silvisoli]